MQNILSGSAGDPLDQRPQSLTSSPQLKPEEKRISKEKCGQWIEKLKTELNGKQNGKKVEPMVKERRHFSTVKAAMSDDQPDERPSLKTQSNRIGPKTDTRNEKTSALNQSKTANGKLQSNGSGQKTVERQTNGHKSSNGFSGGGFARHLAEMSKSSTTNNHRSVGVITNTLSNCSRCGDKVLTVDKIIVGGVHFHRSCLTCAKCGVTLRLSEVRSAVNERVVKSNRPGGQYLCILCNKTASPPAKSFFKTQSSDKVDGVDASVVDAVSRQRREDEYQRKLKERMKWKEMFLFSNDSSAAYSVINKDTPDKGQSANVQSNLLNERIEFENSSLSFELYDDDELTKMLNLDQNDEWQPHEDEEEEEEGGDEEEEDEEEEDEEVATSTLDNSTDDDFSSDQFDVSEEANRYRSHQFQRSKSEIGHEVPVIVVSQELPVNTSGAEGENEEEENTLNEFKEGLLDEVPLSPQSLNLNDNLCPFGNNSGQLSNSNTLRDDQKSGVISRQESNHGNRVGFNQKSSHTSSGSPKKPEVFKRDSLEHCPASSSGENSSSEQTFSDLDLVSVVNDTTTTSRHTNENSDVCPTIIPSTGLHHLDSKHRFSSSIGEHMKDADHIDKDDLSGHDFSFRVKTPKLFSLEVYSKIPVLATRVNSAQQHSTCPVYSGSFTEKLLKCRSSPTLNQSICSSFSLSQEPPNRPSPPPPTIQNFYSSQTTPTTVHLSNVNNLNSLAYPPHWNLSASSVLDRKKGAHEVHDHFV